MGSKNQPGTFDCYHNALPDEPMFVLLARDPSAPELVEDWATERQRQINKGFRPQSDQAMVDEAVRCAANMRHWRVVNNGAWRGQPAAAPRVCARCQGSGLFQSGNQCYRCYGTGIDPAVVAQPDAAPVTGRFGEPVWPNNDEANDFDKGDDA